MLKGNIATACIDAGLSTPSFSGDSSSSSADFWTTVVVCLSVLYMQKRDERRAKALESDVPDEDSSIAETSDVDSKVKVSID